MDTTDTTFTQSNLSVSSAVLKPAFPSMNKHAPASARAKPKPDHCAVMIAMKKKKKDLHQNTELEAAPSMKTSVSRSIKLRKNGIGWTPSSGRSCH